MNIIKEPLVYFKNLSAYDSAWNGTDANVRFDPNTKNDAIIFVEDSGKIYTHGHSFGGGSSSFEDGDKINIINDGDKYIISPDNLPVATYTSKGIVQVAQGGGITVNNGTISANIPEIVNGIKGQDGIDGIDGLTQVIWDKIKGTPGENGLKGDPGEDGFDPYIGADGYWYTRTGKTNVKASGEGQIAGGYLVDATVSGMDGGSGQRLTITKSNGQTVSIDNVNNGAVGGISLQEGHAITIDSIDWNTGTTQYTIGVDESQLNLGEAIKTNVVVTPTYNANSENVEMIATIAIDNEVKGIYAHAGGSGEPAQYIKKATYENRVLTLFPNSGENIVVTVPTSSGGGTGGGTYYGGTGITINEENLISAKQATRDERGAVKIWEKDNNVTIDGITLGDSDNRRYAVNLDSNGVAYVQVPWSDTPFDPVNNEYIQNKLNEAELRSNELAGEIEDVADQMNAVLDEDFAEKLNRAKDAIDNAQNELDQLHTLLESDVVIKTDPVYTNLAAYLDRGNNAYYSFDEAIDLTLVDKLSDENPEATVYSKVLKIVKDNSVDGETVNGRIDSAVTNVKDEITVDLNGYAKKQFVADTVRTEVDAATESVYDTYSDAGLTIASEGYVKIDASKAKFTNGEAQSQSLAEIITDAENGILATAGSKDFVAGNLREAGLSIGTDGKFSLLSQFRDLQEDGTSGDLRTLAGIIGDSGGMDAKIGLVAKSKINENKATIIGWVKEDTSGIELTADQIILNAEETIADHINALDITTGNLTATNANIQSRLTAAEANITNLLAHTINTDQLKTGVADAGYLIIGRTNSDDVTAFTPKGLYFALNREEIYRTLNSDGATWAALSTDEAYDNLFGLTSLMSNNGFYFYPNGTSGNGAYGIDVKSIGSDDKTNVETWLHMSSKDGTTYMGPNYFISSSKAITGSGDGGLQQWTTNLMSDGASYTYISPNNGVIASKTDNNIEYYSVVSGGESGRIFVGTEQGTYSSINKEGIVITDGKSNGDYTEVRITDDHVQVVENGVNKVNINSTYSEFKGDLLVGGSIYCDRVYRYQGGSLVMEITNPTTTDQYGTVIVPKLIVLDKSASGDSWSGNKAFLSNTGLGFETSLDGTPSVITTGEILKLTAQSSGSGYTGIEINDNDEKITLYTKEIDVPFEYNSQMTELQYTVLKFGDENNAGNACIKMSIGPGNSEWDINTLYSDIKFTGGHVSFDNSIYVSGQTISSSDRDLKNIGSDITLTAEQVANAPAVNFTWKNDENNINHVGSIAQYWQVVMPEVVSETKNGLGLDYSTTALMSAITVAKELVALKEEIAQLKAQINELTSNN